jgi:hypothetical protein
MLLIGLVQDNNGIKKPINIGKYFICLLINK